MSDDSTAGIAVHYTESELELLDENCRTALSFEEQDQQSEQKLLIEKMGRRAKAKRQRAARIAAENQAAEIESRDVDRTDETDCEIPSTKSTSSVSKIPVLQKGYQATRGSERSNSETSQTSSKIPRPVAQLVYLKNRSELPTESSELSSYTAPSKDFTDSEMITCSQKGTIPRDLSPLPKCDLSTEMELPTKDVKDDPEHVVVVVEANGSELKLDMTAMLSGLDLQLVGLRFI